ncbi:MAG: LPS export ABC transporter periplasmic protein LptC [Treponema sp.]|nr:LPS export ABC transporter periplasmic protein LptC [Treponema sp.]
MKKNENRARGAVCKLTILVSILFLLESCTFDYGDSASSDSNMPDLIMENVDYVRVRAADPIARFQAERAERYEKQGLMKLQNFSFEQYGERGKEVNASGQGGRAEAVIESGDISMTNGVRLEVGSEDIIIETENLDWKDEPRMFYTGPQDKVTIYRENGTVFNGVGLTADTRRRTFEFTGYVTGTYIHDDLEEESVLTENE